MSGAAAEIGAAFRGTLGAFTLDLAAKDLELAQRLGERVGAALEQAGTTAAVVSEAIASGNLPSKTSRTLPHHPRASASSPWSR